MAKTKASPIRVYHQTHPEIFVSFLQHVRGNGATVPRGSPASRLCPSDTRSCHLRLSNQHPPHNLQQRSPQQLLRDRGHCPPRHSCRQVIKLCSNYLYIPWVQTKVPTKYNGSLPPESALCFLQVFFNTAALLWRLKIGQIVANARFTQLLNKYV